MNSRPGPGISESLQPRGSVAGPAAAQARRRSSKPSNQPYHVKQEDCIDPTLESERWSVDETTGKSRALPNIRAKPAPLEGTNETTRPPPRGRPQLFFTNVPTNAFDMHTQSPASQSTPTGMNLPVPPRPGLSLPGDAAQQRRMIPGGTGVKTEVATKPLPSEAPAPAVVFSGGRTADLFVWTGNQPEDTLSEALVKGGISNKPQIMNETNTARPSLWSNLKNKSGLSTLSTLFVAVLEKRQTCGRLTAPNTFKPPPRLTLRDSTRETWLHDLANPTVSLRRLSRTIPHGVTGKVLLEQCLNKSIPIPRAIWLAKCVGINEMRSHKRKGQASTMTSGTITWVRGWTGAVEQFLDSIVSTIGQQAWKPRITYAIQLATHLYKEHLLEDEHYLDWLLKNLESSSQERLFIWLLLVSVYWADITSVRRRGKRLSEILLSHDSMIRSDDEKARSPIQGFLESTIVKLLITSPVCFLSPSKWNAHGTSIRAIASNHCLPQLDRLVANLNRRNNRLRVPSEQSKQITYDMTQQVVHILDSIDYTFSVSVESLAVECMQRIPDTRKLISIVLHWTSSLHRTGPHRVYIATRLLRRWSYLGVDVDDAILACLHSMDSNRSLDPQNIFRVVAELVRSKTFALGKYMQWLIATGSTGQIYDLTSPAAWPLRLIVEIPLTGTPEPVLNLRRTLLRGTNYSADSEDASLDEAEWALQQQLPGLFGDVYPSGHAISINASTLSPTVRLELGIWLRSRVHASCQNVDRVSTKDPSVELSGPVCTITARDFQFIRSYLEEFGDFSILADVIGIVSASLDSAVLASACDALQYNHKTFGAIGALKPLVEKLARKYTSIRNIRFLERDFLAGLAELAQTTHTEGYLMQSLTYDLGRQDFKGSLAACSPVSDTMADAIHASSIDADDEIDRILSSGTSMDHQIMTRVFEKIAFSIETLSTTNFDNLQNWFHRLRSFDENTFDKLVTEWIESLVTTFRNPVLKVALPPLVVSGCMPLRRFVSISNRCISKLKEADPPAGSKMSTDILDVVLPPSNLHGPCQSSMLYRYRLRQLQLSEDRESGILSIVQHLIACSSSLQAHEDQAQVTNILSSIRLHRVLMCMTVSNYEWVSLHLYSGETNSVEQPPLMGNLLQSLLDPTNHLRLPSGSLDQQIVRVVDSCDAFTLPFARLEIQRLFIAGATVTNDAADAISEALLDSVKAAVEKDESPWLELVSGLSAPIKSKICDYAEREILNASSFLLSPGTLDLNQSSIGEDPFRLKYVRIVDSTVSEVSKENHNFVLGAIVERLRGAADALNRVDDYMKQSSHPEQVPEILNSIHWWLDSLLHLCIVHDSVPWHRNESPVQAALLWGLRTLFTHPVVQKYSALVEQIFDVAVLLSDSLSDESRARLAQLNTAKPADDARCSFIFGGTRINDAWLGLSKPIVSSSSQHQPQSALLPQSQQHSNQSTSPSTFQRSVSQQHQQQLGQHLVQPRGYPQYPQYPQQQQKLPPQVQRSFVAGGQAQQQNQIQQTQAVAQHRNPQSSSSHQSRPTAITSSQTGKGSFTKHEKVDIKILPFAIKSWEILPENGGNSIANDTAINLSLFGARKV
ncbi:hypothetical protein EJ04DRAFT_220246 [Polyplosphaeria fusca]|uniref:Mediator of RNA polymerase II transcription subunit 12 n=1 Tax=Polyplosphaeria fusca TaxID=682080 RepID=A0A9P4V495_9PLEO|nr:hypothetical protein EJ04DRAFT_220246 [Polyplosphaeria fusca]